MAKTIGQLTQATTIAGGDEFVIEQSGLTKRVAASVVRGGLVNADIDAAAAIAGTKLADGGVATAKIADAAVTAAKLDGAQTGSAPIYGCRAFVNFDATVDADGNSTAANTNRFLRNKGNVSSVLKTASGNFTVNFTTAMANNGYCTVLGAIGGDPNKTIRVVSQSTGSVSVAYGNPSDNSAGNPSIINVAIFA